MNQIDEKIEKLQSLIGYESSEKFETEVFDAISQLANAMQQNPADHEIKVSYATHVFAKMLDNLADLITEPVILN